MRADEAIVLFFKAPHKDAAGPPLQTLASLIQCSTRLALSWAIMLGFPRQVVITQVVIEQVAR